MTAAMTAPWLAAAGQLCNPVVEQQRGQPETSGKGIAQPGDPDHRLHLQRVNGEQQRTHQHRRWREAVLWLLGFDAALDVLRWADLTPLAVALLSLMTSVRPAVKDVDRLEAAYNDSSGVTAEFNLNLLDRINREFDADFDRDRFRHHAFFNPIESRIEMHLVSEVEQTVSIAGETIRLRSEETICTEHSYKFTVEAFVSLAAEAGLQFNDVWMDDEDLFAVLLFRCDAHTR